MFGSVICKLRWYANWYGYFQGEVVLEMSDTNGEPIRPKSQNITPVVEEHRIDIESELPDDDKSSEWSRLTLLLLIFHSSFFVSSFI